MSVDLRLSAAQRAARVRQVRRMLADLYKRRNTAVALHDRIEESRLTGLIRIYQDELAEHQAVPGDAA